MTVPKLIHGRYELGDLLGYGGMAEVHRGRDTRLSRDVAVKVLRSDLARDPSFQNRFRREAQAAAGLNHPSIVAVYDTGEDTDPEATDDTPRPFIVMEYVEGLTLREVLKNEGHLPARRAMEITSEICAALDFSHRSGIVHRDIKPANVMITRTGAVKVMDFGIARAMADNAATVTATAAVIGTAQYLSPEQARGESVDARSDVYSTGCLLYELLTGHPPFTGDSPVAVAYQHVRETARIPSSVNPAVPRELDSIVMKALAKNPLNRYQTAAEMRTDLQRGIAGQQVEAEAVMTDAERTQFIAPAPRPGVSATPPRAGVLTPTYAEEDDTRGHRGAVIWGVLVLVLLLVLGGGALVLLKTRDNKPPPIAHIKVGSLVGLDPVAVASQLALQKFNVIPNHQLVHTDCSSGAQGAAPIPGVKGRICTQTPPADEVVNVGSDVTFTIYGGPADVQVPPVKNETLAQANADLTKATLQSGEIKPVDSPLPANTVIDQDPPAYTPVAPHTSVNLTVANGKSKLPSILHLTFDHAKAKLNPTWPHVAQDTQIVKPGFKVGEVQAMDPNPEYFYDPATTTVTLYVAIAAPPTTPAPSAPASSPTASSSPAAPAVPAATCTTAGAPATSSPVPGAAPLPACS